jgi:hypothetical protein
MANAGVANISAPIVVEFTREESEQLAQQAHAQGYDDPVTYVRALVAEAADEDDENSAKDFRAACGEAMRDETLTWDEFVAAMN